MSTAIHPSPAVDQRPPAIGTIVACPDMSCDQPAEVLDTWVWSSTSGPVTHLRTRCLARHVFTPPVDWIVPAAPDRVAGDA